MLFLEVDVVVDHNSHKMCTDLSFPLGSLQNGREPHLQASADVYYVSSWLSKLQMHKGTPPFSTFSSKDTYLGKHDRSGRPGFRERAGTYR